MEKWRQGSHPRRSKGGGLEKIVKCGGEIKDEVWWRGGEAPREEALAAGLPDDEDEPEAGGAASPVRLLPPGAATLRSTLLPAPDWPPVGLGLLFPDAEDDPPAGCCLMVQRF
jgi:hypothetical protein